MDVVKYDTIIVGGGIAGLTSAAYLSRADKKILLVEKNKEFGGLVSSFQRDGFHFEAGVRALESAGIILPMLEDMGIELETVPSKVSVGVENRIVSIEDINSIKEYRNMLAALFPASVSEIDDFIRSMRKIMKHLDVLYGIDNPIIKNFKKDRRYIFTKLLPWLPRFIFTIGKINRLSVPVEDYLKEIIKDSSLRDVISQHFFKGTPAFFALSYFSLYLDYFYPRGGVGKIVEALVEKIKGFDGELKPETLITEVHAEKQYVADSHQNRYGFENLIWAADLKTLYKILKVENLDPEIQKSLNVREKSILTGKGSESVFSLYLEVDLPLSYFREIAHGHFFYTPSKQGLNDIHRGELKQLINGWEDHTKEDVLSWCDRFLTFNTYEISIPGLKDESLVPPGKTGLIVSFIIDYELFKKVEESGWYDEFKEGIESKMIQVLTDSVYPKLKDKIQKQFSFAPIDYKKRVCSTDGAIVGWSFENKIPVEHKIQHSARSVLTPIPNIFQAGQWSYSPAGVPMSILTGKIAADKVSK